MENIMCLHFNMQEKNILSIQMPSVDAYTYDIDDYCVG
jgi:hypothetical protein